MQIAVDNAELYVGIRGKGPPVLVLHGGLGLDSSYLTPYLDDLAEHCRLILPDLRGHGRSTGEDTLGTATHATLVDDLRRLREALAIDQWTVMGHSYGGFIAMEYALSHREDLNGLILCATSASLAHGAEALASASRHASPKLMESLVRAISTPASSDDDFAHTWRSIAPLYFAQAEKLNGAFDDIRYSAVGFNRGNFDWLPGYDLRSRLSDIDLPTLVLSGEHDWLMPPHLAGGELATRIPRATHYVFGDSGHYPFIEECAEFCRVVAEWLPDLDDAGR